jgi:hypothetical protein
MPGFKGRTGEACVPLPLKLMLKEISVKGTQCLGFHGLGYIRILDFIMMVAILVRPDDTVRSRMTRSLAGRRWQMPIRPQRLVKEHQELQ